MRQWGGHSITQGQSIVLVVDNKAQRASVAEEIKRQVQTGKLDVFEQGADLSGASNVDGVVVYGSVTSANLDNTLTQALKTLKPGGFVVLCVPQGGVSDDDASEKLMFSGFVNTKITKVGEFSEIASSKPDWEVGASQKLNLKKAAPAPQDSRNIWTATATNDENDMIDEDSLLSEADRSAKPKTKADDCEVGKTGKKACKNCSCGRADEPTADAPAPKPKLTKEMLENPGVGSNCGSCGLGDAFRCGGCPYRGLPAFKVGEKITIPDNFMADDI